MTERRWTGRALAGLSFRRQTALARAAAALLALILLGIAVGCGRPREPVALAPLPTATAVGAPVYEPIRFPRDEAPHDTLLEWWYYTGHLRTEGGERFGFELVIFQSVRNDLVFYLSHFAITDPGRGRFVHDFRTSQGSQIGGQDGFDLQVGEWAMRGALGHDQLSARLDDYAISLRLTALKPPVLHDDDGLVSFGPAGDSYYYSRTRMAVEGTLIDHGQPERVSGQAWFDKQWGNFLILGGGWDWFSVQLDDGADLMLNLLRNEQNEVVGVWGTYVAADGAQRPLRAEDFRVEPTGSWVSPHSGGRYPMGWSVSLTEPDYRLTLTPLLEDQELLAENQGPTYWEGAVDVEGTRGQHPVRGLGYVEMTGYAPR